MRANAPYIWLAARVAIPRRCSKCFLFLSLLLASVAPGEGQTAPIGTSNQRPKITVWVHNYANVLPGTLAVAEEEAGMIFRHAGVEVTWVNCPLRGPEAAGVPVCHVPPAPADFALRILSREMAERLTFRAEDLGFALPCPESERGCVANVFYHRAQELAGGGAFPCDILSRAMAHEIGHLLLGLNAHSPNGIMRAKWHAEDLQHSAGPYLLFTPKQAELIRANAAHRDRAAQLGGRSQEPALGSEKAER